MDKQKIIIGLLVIILILIIVALRALTADYRPRPSKTLLSVKEQNRNIGISLQTKYNNLEFLLLKILEDSMRQKVADASDGDTIGNQQQFWAELYGNHWTRPDVKEFIKIELDNLKLYLSPDVKVNK